MLLPYAADVPMQRRPFAAWLLIVLLVTSSILGIIQRTPGKEEKLLIQEGVPNWLIVAYGFLNDRRAPVGALAHNHFAISQLFSHSLVDERIFRLLGCSIFLFCFGNAVNARLGHGLFLFLYFSLSLVSGAVWWLLSGEGALSGASGAIAGIMGIFVIFYPKNEVRIFYYGFGKRVGSFTLVAIFVVMAAFIFDLLQALRSPNSGAVTISHLVSFIGGIAAGAIFLLLGIVKPCSAEENLLEVLGWEKKTPARETTTRNNNGHNATSLPRRVASGRS
jgi:membrane associated rhomboid family serine protease